MSARTSLSRHQWQQAALTSYFGEEPEVGDPWSRLSDALASFTALTSETLGAAVSDAASLDASAMELLGGASGQDSTPVADLDRRRPLRVVLMGRTMAGKSSLLAALTGSHHNRIGDGRQRFSRDTLGARTLMSEHLEVIDTPGVGAYGGADDTDTAVAAALDADVVVWVNSSDSIQEESAATLRLLGVLGKPIIVAINCRQSLDGIGRSSLLRFPDRVFGNKEGLLDEIKRHLADAGVKPLDVVHLHALAAAEALAHEAIDSALHAASRIQDLNDALLREYTSHNESRRALRLVDRTRQQAEELACLLDHGADALVTRAAHARESTRDLHTRLSRVLKHAQEARVADVELAVGDRRDWHLAVIDFGESLQSEWEEEVAALQGEVTRALEMRSTALADEVRRAVQDTEIEWAAVSKETFAFRDLASFHGVWGNRLARAGVGVGGSLLGGSAGALLGAYIGGVVGLPTGPGAIVTTVVGAVVGGVGGALAGRLKHLVDRVFLGKVGALRKRREQVAEQVGPVLDEATHEYAKAITTETSQIQDRLALARDSSDRRSYLLQDVATRWLRHSDDLRDLTAELDRETAVALLRICRRERLARSVRRATRVPGVCVLIEFEDAAFWESWLFPPDAGETLAGGRCPSPGGEAAVALSYMLSLSEAPVRLLRADSKSARLTISAEIPAPIVQTWTDALGTHLSSEIRIETTRKSVG